MSKEKRRVPKLRFPGFTEDWEQRKFLDLLDSQNGIRRGPFGSSLKKDSFVKKSDYVVYEQQNAIYDNYETRYFISKEKYNELIRFNIQPGDFIMSGAGTIGRISMVPDGIKKGVFNQALIRFKVNKDSINPLYFLKFMQSDMMQKQLTQANPGSAMTNLVPMDELKKWDVTIPSLEEQNKISTFINQIDEFITLHQRKLEHLNLKKKALLQKLFPKNGERYPELRFPGFTDAWEQRKFGEIMTFLNGRAYKQDELLGDGKYKVLRVGNFYTNDSWYYSNLELDDKFYATNGDLLYTWSATFGPHIWKGEKVIYHYHIWKLVLQDKIDKLFALQLLEVDKANIMSDKNGSTMVHITKQGMENKQTILPISLNEQKQIAKFLSSMDKLITLHQRKLKHLQLQKKALLQQMFV